MIVFNDTAVPFKTRRKLCATTNAYVHFVKGLLRIQALAETVHHIAVHCVKQWQEKTMQRLDTAARPPDVTIMMTGNPNGTIMIMILVTDAICDEYVVCVKKDMS